EFPEMAMSLNAREKQFALTSMTGVLLTGVILVLGNILMNWVYLRWDMTRNHAYSLSPSSKRILRSLDDIVLIKAYCTPDLPSPYNLYTPYIKDTLVEYAN